jgi:alkanesulfonate monooxygenase SsuD/methylene tetrahydromethanopterin reductase-like flavin-dependent oxidoreductase (luciferase family)
LDDARGHVLAGAERAGRDPDTIGMQGRVDWRGDVDNVAAQVDKWREAGATHLGINTMDGSPQPLEHHLEHLATVAKAIL